MTRRLILALAIVAVAAMPAQARGGPGGDRGAGHFGGHEQFEHFGGHERFEHFEHFHHGFVGPRVLIGPETFWYPPTYPYFPPPVYAEPPQGYVQPAPGYWYYCTSAGAYYPDVASCAEAWLPVPAPVQ
jgi:hypothetical protein